MKAAQKSLLLIALGNIRRRMLDLGIVPGTWVKPVFRSPAHDPTAYEVRGTLLALRAEDAHTIEVER